MPSVHAKLQPSAAKRWMNCPGSITLGENVVDAGSQYADEGTACHEICEQVLNGKPWPTMGSKMSNGVTVTQEMLDLCKPCVEFVEDYRDATGAKVLTEQKVEIGRSFGLPDGLLFGTSDIVAISKRELLVADFKFGYNAVEVEKNPQLLLYAKGVGNTVREPDLVSVERLRLAILQPKCGDPREVSYALTEVHAFMEEMTPKIVQASKGGALVAGPWCAETFCKARAVCPALRDEMVALAQREWANPLIHTPEELGELLAKLSMIEDAASALRAHAMKMDELGQKIPGWKRVKGDTKRKWLAEDDKDTAAKLKKLGVDPWEKSLVSPAGAEEQLVQILHKKQGGTKKAAKEAAKEILKAVAGKPDGKPVLVPDTDPRPALGPVFTMEDVAALDSAKTVDVID